MKNEIGKRIKEARISKGIRHQKDFAKMLDLHTASLSKIESGESLTSIETLLKIHKITGINLHWILTGEGTPETPAGGIDDKELLMMLEYFKKSPRLKHLVMGEFYKHLEQFEKELNASTNQKEEKG